MYPPSQPNYGQQTPPTPPPGMPQHPVSASQPPPNAAPPPRHPGQHPGAYAAPTAPAAGTSSPLQRTMLWVFLAGAASTAIGVLLTLVERIVYIDAYARVFQGTSDTFIVAGLIDILSLLFIVTGGALLAGGIGLAFYLRHSSARPAAAVPAANTPPQATTWQSQQPRP